MRVPAKQFASLIVPAVLAAALMPWQQALAFETRVFSVYGNMEGGDSTTRGRLYDRLFRFAQDVKIAAARRNIRVILEVQVLPERQLPVAAGRVVSRRTNQLWSDRPDSIAFLWGRVDPGARNDEAYPSGTIYIGVAPIESLLPERTRPALFGPVPGQVNAGWDDLDAYEIIVGYALLRRIWRERRYVLMAPIAEVLKQRMRATEAGGSYGSWEACLTTIREATTGILTARRPRPTENPLTAPALPPPIACS